MVAFVANTLFLRLMKTVVTIILLSIAALTPSAAQECDLLVDRTDVNGRIRTTRENTFYQHEGRRLRFYMEQSNEQLVLAANWYISPKTLPEGQKFNGKKPLEISLALENDDIVVLTIVEAIPGSATYKLKYADYMIGGSALISPEVAQRLQASPIKSMSESLYGITPYKVKDVLLPQYFINTISCLQQ